ncbi:SRPBCC family protein [Gordonia iterans]
MKTVIVERTAAAPVERVWAVLTDLDAAADVLSGVARIERVEGEGYAPGVVWRETRTVMGAEETEEMTVAEVDAPHRTVITSLSRGVAYRTEFTLTSESPASTTITMRFAGDSTATGLRALIGKVTAPLGAAVARKMMRADLNDLARAAESS